MVLTPWFKVVLSTLPLLQGPSTHLFEVFRLMLSYELRHPTQIKDLQGHGKSRGRRKHFGKSWKSISLLYSDADYLLLCLFDLPIYIYESGLSSHILKNFVLRMVLTPWFKLSLSDCTGVSRSVHPSIRGLSPHVILRAAAPHTYNRPLRSWEIKVNDAHLCSD